MVLNRAASAALKKKDQKALAAALKAEYGSAADYLSKKLLGLIHDDNKIL